MPEKPASSRRSAARTRRLPASAGQVWEVMATPGALARYHPFCSANPVAKWPGVGAQDEIHYLSGLVLRREFTVWDEGRGYELEVGGDRWPSSRVRWELTTRGAEESELTIRIWPTAFAGYPSALRRALYGCFLVPLLRRYLDAVLRGLDSYVTSGCEVTPNQFGRVWLFSYGFRRPA